MDGGLKTALLGNLILKTKIVIGLFIGVLVLQTVGIFTIHSLKIVDDLPLGQILIIPAFILTVVVGEFFILKYTRLALKGLKPFPQAWHYLICILEAGYPTLVLYYGSILVNDHIENMNTFMFLNSPPLLIYILMIVLSTFHFNFKICLISGILSALGFASVSFVFLEQEELIVNLSKGPFLVVTGLFCGVVARKLVKSVKSSLEAKNTLIHTLDSKVKERTAEVEAQKEELEIKNREITDSIVYAKRIQSAILPEPEMFQKFLPSSFVLYKPKDIVAGDFYWLENTKEGTLFAVADCTGHGVPGALVSVVCSHALNQSVREFGKKTPGEILDKTRELIIHEFSSSQQEVKDGMDVALCLLKGKYLRYAGANNPIWIVRHGEMIELKPNKQPVGKHAQEAPFETKEFNLADGDALYLFSDGFADQFGGVKAKKFKSASLKKLILSIQTLPMDKQCAKLEESFEKWRGSLEQVDDVCVIGVRI